MQDRVPSFHVLRDPRGGFAVLDVASGRLVLVGAQRSAVMDLFAGWTGAGFPDLVAELLDQVGTGREHRAYSRPITWHEALVSDLCNGGQTALNLRLVAVQPDSAGTSEEGPVDMGQQIIRQPDGRYAVFSSVTDTITYWGLSMMGLVEVFARIAAEKERRRVAVILAAVDAGRPEEVYHQFALSWEEALALDTEHGGQTAERYAAFLAALARTPEQKAQDARLLALTMQVPTKTTGWSWGLIYPPHLTGLPLSPEVARAWWLRDVLAKLEKTLHGREPSTVLLRETLRRHRELTDRCRTMQDLAAQEPDNRAVAAMAATLEGVLDVVAAIYSDEPGYRDLWP